MHRKGDTCSAKRRQKSRRGDRQEISRDRRDRDKEMKRQRGDKEGAHATRRQTQALLSHVLAAAATHRQMLERQKQRQQTETAETDKLEAHEETQRYA